MTLTEFLLARIAEDEADARHAAEESTDPIWHWEGGPMGWVGAHSLSMACDLYADVGAHIARWDPERTLAECEAKRQLVSNAMNVPTISMRRVLRVLAVIYADHPDYHEEWRP